MIELPPVLAWCRCKHSEGTHEMIQGVFRCTVQGCGCLAWDFEMMYPAAG